MGLSETFNREAYIIVNGMGKPFTIEEVEISTSGSKKITGYIDEFIRRKTNVKANCDSKFKNVIFNNPATIVIWEDGTKTVVKCQDGDTYSKELGLAMCIAKKFLGNKGNFNEVFKNYINEKER